MRRSRTEFGAGGMCFLVDALQERNGELAIRQELSRGGEELGGWWLIAVDLA